MMTGEGKRGKKSKRMRGVVGRIKRSGFGGASLSLSYSTILVLSVGEAMIRNLSSAHAQIGC